MRVEEAFVGARGVDSYPFSIGGTAKQAKALAATGIEFFVGYLGVIDKVRLGYVLAAGLAFMPVTKAGEYEDGADDEIAQIAALGLPKGCTVWLDLEGLKAFHDDPVLLAKKVNDWADKIAANGFMPGLYIGSPQPFTSAELFSLHVVRYWWGLGECRDRFGELASPACGYCMVQQFHGQKSGMMWKNTGVFVDTNGVGKDFRFRLPFWVVA